MYRQWINYNVFLSRFNTTDFYTSFKLLGHVLSVNIIFFNLNFSARKDCKGFCMDQGRCSAPRWISALLHLNFLSFAWCQRKMHCQRLKFLIYINIKKCISQCTNILKVLHISRRQKLLICLKGKYKRTWLASAYWCILIQ